MSKIEVFEVQCGECESDFEIESTQAGTTVLCPHCDSPAEIPTMAEIMGEEADPVDAEPAPPSKPSSKSKKQNSTQNQKKKPTGKSSEKNAPSKPPNKSSGRVKPATVRSSVQILLKMTGSFYYLACFVGIAWSIKVVGTLYPIVNTKRGSYFDWFVEATITTAWAAALMGILIAVAELIKVIVYLYENNHADS